MNHLDIRRIAKGTAATLAAGIALVAIAPLGAQAALVPSGCTHMTAGPHTGVINVAANQKECLLLAVQNGAVNVAPGGALDVEGSTITGAVTLVGGFETLEFCGSSTVRGAISATGGIGAVRIGGSGLLGALDCTANTIDGAVTLDANQAGVEVSNNGVVGAVMANANLGGTLLSGNRIGGALTCTMNAPPPVNGGVANAVAGARFGQTCSVLTF
jgi:hypothetical protein